MNSRSKAAVLVYNSLTLNINFSIKCDYRIWNAAMKEADISTRLRCMETERRESTYPSMCLLGTSFTLKTPYTGLQEKETLYGSKNVSSRI